MKTKLLCLSILAIFLFAGCAKKEVKVEKPKDQIVHTYNLNDTVIELAKGLSKNLKMDGEETGDIAVTAFVELRNFKKTSKFGRLLSESLYHELYSRNVRLLDFRAKKAISIDAYGEYFLSRKINKLNAAINTSHILVGTYSNIDNGLSINARVINTQTGKIITTARVIYHTEYCKIYNNCKPLNTPTKIVSTRY